MIGLLLLAIWRWVVAHVYGPESAYPAAALRSVHLAIEETQR